jgi:hypothetical protein
MEVQTEFLWDEKNLTEQPMNYENKNEQGINDTTKNISINLMQNDWRNITDPKLRKKMRHKAYSKAWFQANKDKITKKQKKYRQENKDKIKLTTKAYYETNQDKIKAYRKANKEKLSTYNKIYNKVKRNKINEYKKNREKTNILYKLSMRLRSRLNSAIKNNYKSGSAVKDLGCTIDELKIYLESKFHPGMTWDNWGIYGWHIDHIKPLICFDLTNREQLLQAVHYTNLQPLWAKDNLSKNRNFIA